MNRDKNRGGVIEKKKKKNKKELLGKRYVERFVQKWKAFYDDKMKSLETNENAALKRSSPRILRVA